MLFGDSRKEYGDSPYTVTIINGWCWYRTDYIALQHTPTCNTRMTGLVPDLFPEGNEPHFMSGRCGIANIIVYLLQVAPKIGV